MDDEVKVTRADIEAALRQWETDAESGKWPDRTDDARYRDNADYLFGLLKK